jgi:hypothetical protein
MVAEQRLLHAKAARARYLASLLVCGPAALRRWRWHASRLYETALYLFGGLTTLRLRRTRRALDTWWRSTRSQHAAEAVNETVRVHARGKLRRTRTRRALETWWRSTRSDRPAEAVQLYAEHTLRHTRTRRAVDIWQRATVWYAARVHACGALRHRRTRHAVDMWQRATRSACAAAAAVEVARVHAGDALLRAAIVRWRHVRVCAWRAQALSDLGSAAANSLAANRCLGAWRCRTEAAATKRRVAQARVAQVCATTQALWQPHKRALEYSRTALARSWPEG